MPGVVLDSGREIATYVISVDDHPFLNPWTFRAFFLGLGLSTFAHLLLWNSDDLRGAWSWISPSDLYKQWKEFYVEQRQAFGDPYNRRSNNTPLQYPDAPNNWYYTTFMYKSDSTLPWWGFVIAVVLAAISILFLRALSAIMGVTLSILTVRFPRIDFGTLHCLTHLVPDTVSQAILLLRDLKIGQYTKLPPRAAFTAQIIGTLLGAILNYCKRGHPALRPRNEHLVRIATSSIQLPGDRMGRTQSRVVLRRYEVSVGSVVILSWARCSGTVLAGPPLLAQAPLIHTNYMVVGWFGGGINSMVLSYFMIVFASQWWIRTRYPSWFQKCNYLVGAGVFVFRVCVRRPSYAVWQLSTAVPQVMVFILSFAVEGAASTSHLFPAWWGANQDGNYDRCLYHG
ncbi:OPT oligopeptide transporter protein-domain-containing protein [Boletus edulis]|nr:OPT oligopeptide transporter protein-domain-containing protein [Boletus edulis]